MLIQQQMHPATLGPIESGLPVIHKRVVGPETPPSDPISTTKLPSSTRSNKPSPTTSAHASHSFANNATQSITAFPLPSTTSSSSFSLPYQTVSNPVPEIPGPPGHGAPSSHPDETSPSAAAESGGSNDSTLPVSSGGIAGIVVGVVAAAAIGLFALLFVRRKRKRQPIDSYSRRVSSFGQAEFFAGPSPVAAPPPTPVMTTTPNSYGSTTAAAAGSSALPYHNVATTHASSPSPNSTFAPAPFLQQYRPADDPFQHPPLGTYTVVSTYMPTLDDEIVVHPGDHVQVFTEYDDGWCLGVNLSRGQIRGVFPKHCVLPQSPSLESTSAAGGSAPVLAVDHKRLSKRGSSLYNG